MHRLIRLFLKLGLVTASVLTLLISWHTIGRANPGAPILLVVNDSYAGNKFGRYLGEILRAEGLNAFELIELNSLTAADLTDHDLTILAETALTSPQATLFNNYVNGGGRLIAMRPDSQIEDLFGLDSPSGILNNGYVRINTSAILNGSIPGQGLTSATLQIHGGADRYSIVGGAVTLAQLYSDANTATSHPAVVSAATGRAVAFTYDLARNVVYTRQGNPANANVDTDGDGVLRTVDLFQSSGGGAPWVNRNKISIPQADEQQRLFARLVKQMVGEVRPLPQLWYFPDNAKTMLIPTGDAHANPTSYYQNEITSLNGHGGTLTFYISQAGEPSSSQMNSWRSQGYEFGIHPSRPLTSGYMTINDWWDMTHPTVPKSRTVRNHQVAWEGWTAAADIEVTYGMALDTNFYHWGTWLQKGDDSWPHGYITGSGQPMKFIRADGTVLPLYQQLTQLVDEHLISGVPGGFENLSATEAISVSKELIDASQAGDYAALMTQFHVDYYGFGAPKEWAEGTLDYANIQGVPIWNADRWLSFTETRHDANYSNINWNDTTKTLTFNLNATATPNVNLSTILPLTYRSNSLQSVQVDGSPASYSTQTIKGVNVAFVNVPAGNHSFTAQYLFTQLSSLYINDVVVTEGNSGTTNAIFTVSLSQASTQTITVNYATVNASATAPPDYTTANGVLTFPPGSITRPITITVQGDTLDEINETFQVNLASPTHAILGDAQGIGVITDDDDSPSLSINDIAIPEGNTGTAQAIFTLSLSAASGKTITITYATADGSATAPADYTPISGTLTFAPTVMTQPLTVTIHGDTLVEGNETFQINLTNPISVTVGDSQGQGTIINDDNPGNPKLFLPIILR